MRISYIFAVGLVVAPTTSVALSIDDFTTTGGVTDAGDPSPGAFTPSPLTQALSPLVTRTMTFEDNSTISALQGGSLLSLGGSLDFSSAPISGSEVASVSYAFTTLLDVTGGATGFSFGTGSADGPLEATLSVVDIDGNSDSSGPLVIEAPIAVDFAYASFTGVDLSRIKSVTLDLVATDFGIDGSIATEFSADGGSLAPIPLPAGLPLLLAGAGALALVRRRAA